MSARSNSAIDPSAVRRASVRAQYAQRGRMLAAVTPGGTAAGAHTLSKYIAGLTYVSTAE